MLKDTTNLRNSNPNTETTVFDPSDQQKLKL